MLYMPAQCRRRSSEHSEIASAKSFSFKTMRHSHHQHKQLDMANSIVLLEIEYLIGYGWVNFFFFLFLSSMKDGICENNNLKVSHSIPVSGARISIAMPS